jgi:DNA (cytosine-5)-methyltransferase 1
VLLENVRGLLRESFQPYFEYILRQLECPSIKPKPHELWQGHDKRIRKYRCSVGYTPEYHVDWRLLDAADFGVPQNRQRVFIIATRSDVPRYTFPLPTHSRIALVRVQKSGQYWDHHGIAKPPTLPGNGGNSDQDDGLLPWVTVRDALYDLPEPARCEGEAWMNHWDVPGARHYTGHAGSILDWPSKTIKAGVHGVPGGENTVVVETGGIRYYTLRETARIQTFPDAHFFTGARVHVTRQVGNAVPCRLAFTVASPLYALVPSDP